MVDLRGSLTPRPVACHGHRDRDRVRRADHVARLNRELLIQVRRERLHAFDRGWPGIRAAEAARDIGERDAAPLRGGDRTVGLSDLVATPGEKRSRRHRTHQPDRAQQISSRQHACMTRGGAHRLLPESPPIGGSLPLTAVPPP